jgi:hypothetical protein
VTVRVSRRPAGLQRTPPMSVRVLISCIRRSRTPVPSSGPPMRASALRTAGSRQVKACGRAAVR